MSSLHVEVLRLRAFERTGKSSSRRTGSIFDGRNDPVDAKSRVVNIVFFARCALSRCAKNACSDSALRSNRILQKSDRSVEFGPMFLAMFLAMWTQQLMM